MSTRWFCNKVSSSVISDKERGKCEIMSEKPLTFSNRAADHKGLSLTHQFSKAQKTLFKILTLMFNPFKIYLFPRKISGQSNDSESIISPYP